MSEKTTQRRFVPIALTAIAAMVLAFGMCGYRESSGSIGDNTRAFMADNYGWPMSFFWRSSEWNSPGPWVREEMVISWARGCFDLTCWGAMLFAFWIRWRDWRWTFSLGSVFRWAWSVAILLLLADLLRSQLSGRLQFASAEGLVELIAEVICYVGLFVAIDYYTQVTTSQLIRRMFSARSVHA